ncbi:MAG: glutamine--fructose-6-phosphate transaminase (isomerizing) [Pseudomonadota bacterium]
MCGIVGAVAEREISRILLEGLKRLEYRGYDSAGLAVITPDGGSIETRRQVGKVQSLVDDVEVSPVYGSTGIAHTRWATHGVPSVANAHPHISNNRIALVHNGIIENYEELREELRAAGYCFRSETDTEVVAHLVDQLTQQHGCLLSGVRAAIKRLTGAYGLGVVSLAEPGKIIAARSGSPLVVGLGIGENFIASDVLALRAVTDRFIFLEEGDLVEVTKDHIKVWDANGDAIHRTQQALELGQDDVSKGNFRHFMQKEIFEQPQVIHRTLEGRLGEHQVLEQAFGLKAPEIFDQAQAVTIVACGTSYYAASVARYWIEELSGLPCTVEIASEFRYRKVAVTPNNLFVTISQSGETADTLAALRIAKDVGFFATATICNVPTSSLVRESDVSLMIMAGTEVGVASTKAFTAQLTDLMLLAILLGRRNGLGAEREAELVQSLHELEKVVDAAISLDPVIDKLAERLIDKHHALFLGRGSMFPVAMEGALKLKEISYIHAEGYPAGELKHGPLALVDDQMPVIAVAPNDELLEKVQSNLQEVRARGGELFVFTDKDTGFEESDGVTVIEVPKVSSLLAPIVYVVPLQLLSYHVAVLKGTDVDQPRNLAKSVTVE